MKRILTFLCVIILLLPNIYVGASSTSLSLARTNITLTLDNATTLSAKKLVEGFKSSTMTLTMSIEKGKKVVKINNKKGTITPKKKGTAKVLITVRSKKTEKCLLSKIVTIKVVKTKVTPTPAVTPTSKVTPTPTPPTNGDYWHTKVENGVTYNIFDVYENNKVVRSSTYTKDYKLISSIQYMTNTSEGGTWTTYYDNDQIAYKQVFTGEVAGIFPKWYRNSNNINGIYYSVDEFLGNISKNSYNPATLNTYRDSYGNVIKAELYGSSGQLLVTGIYTYSGNTMIQGIWQRFDGESWTYSSEDAYYINKSDIIDYPPIPTDEPKPTTGPVPTTTPEVTSGPVPTITPEITSEPEPIEIEIEDSEVEIDWHTIPFSITNEYWQGILAENYFDPDDEFWAEVIQYNPNNKDLQNLIDDFGEG